MVDDKDFIIKTYQRRNGRKNTQKWYMHYCSKCGKKRSYLPRSKTELCSSCAWNNVVREDIGKKISIACKGRTISAAQRASISKTLKGNKNAANISSQAVIERTAKRMGMTVEAYLAQKSMSETLRRIKKNMCDRLIRFVKDERKSVKYFTFKRIELIRHLEERFTNHPETNEPMTWFNYGRISNINCWEIDHKIPLRYKENGSFYWNQEELQDPKSETFKRAWSLENLQPKWAKLNWSKGSRFKD